MLKEEADRVKAMPANACHHKEPKTVCSKGIKMDSTSRKGGNRCAMKIIAKSHYKECCQTTNPKVRVQSLKYS